MTFGPEEATKPIVSNTSLKGALRAALHIVENTPSDSPLGEATHDAINLLLDEANQNIVAGLPEAITDEKLEQLIDLYRAQAVNWEMQQQSEKKTTRRKSKAEPDISMAVDIKLFE